MQFAHMPMVYSPSTPSPTIRHRVCSGKQPLTTLAFHILCLTLLWKPSNLLGADIETLSWLDNTRYAVGFENHVRHGPGMMILPDGTTFQGVFKRGILEPSQSSESVNEPDTAMTEASQETIPEVTDALDFWAAAWMVQNPDQYLSVYSPDFRLAVNESRPAWEMNHRERLLSSSYIQLDVHFDRFNQRANGEVEAQIKQAYRSDSYREISNKVLVLEKRDGRWLILEERQP